MNDERRALSGIDVDRPVRPPLHPIGALRWTWELTLDVINEYRRDGVGDLAASITFWTLLSIPAAVLALVSALSSVRTFVDTDAADDLQREIQDFIARTFADSETLSTAVDELFAGSNAGVVTIATLVAIFSLSRGFAGLIRALDRAYEVEDGRAWWHLRLVAVGIGFATVVIAAGAAVVLAILPELPGGALFQTLAGPVAFLVLVAWAATLFHIGPYHRTPWRYDIPGAVLTAVGWVVATQGFALYVRLADQGNQVQTTVGAVLLGLTLMYVLSIVMLVGAELNDVISRRASVVQQPVSYRARLVTARERLADLRDDGDEHAADNASDASERTAAVADGSAQGDTDLGPEPIDEATERVLGTGSDQRPD